MATIVPTTPGSTGAVLATQAPTSTASQVDKYRNGGKEVLVVNNGGGSPITITRTAKKACEQGVLHDNIITVAAGAVKYLPPVSTTYFNDDDGWVYVTTSAVTSVTYGVVLSN